MVNASLDASQNLYRYLRLKAGWVRREVQFAWHAWRRDRRRLLVRHGGGQSGVGGPVVKLWRMQAYFPDVPLGYNILYCVSGSGIISLEECCCARRYGVKIVSHVNSCAHPAYANDWEAQNCDAAVIHNDLAHFIVYGSRHAKEGANRYLGPTNAPYEIIYNAVDTECFRPTLSPSLDRFNVLVTGFHWIRHRIEPAIRAMPLVRQHYPQARLVIAGRLVPGTGVWDCSRESFEQLMDEVGFYNVKFIPEYTQAEAPSIYAMGDVLVHLKHMDWTPNTVIEGMACGLPVVHAGNGGLPELVGDAGLSLGVPFDWDRVHTPTPEALAETIAQAYERRDELGERAREIAVQRYNIHQWVTRHRLVFERLLSE